MVTLEIKEKVETIVNNYVDRNLNLVLNWSNLGENNITAIKKTAVDIVLLRDFSWNGGGFAKAVVDEKLFETVTFADDILIRSLKLLLLVKRNVHPQVD